MKKFSLGVFSVLVVALLVTGGYLFSQNSLNQTPAAALSSLSSGIAPAQPLPGTTPWAFTTLTVTGSSINFAWTAGTAPYWIEEEAGTSGSWVAVTTPTTSHTASIPISGILWSYAAGKSACFRIQQTSPSLIVSPASTASATKCITLPGTLIPQTPTVTINYENVPIAGGSVSISPGGNNTLQWSAQYASSCVLTASPAFSGWTGTVAISGGKDISALSKATTLTVTCKGNSGASAAKTLTVNLAPPANPTVVTTISQNSSVTPANIQYKYSITNNSNTPLTLKSESIDIHSSQGYTPIGNIDLGTSAAINNIYTGHLLSFNNGTTSIGANDTTLTFTFNNPVTPVVIPAKGTYYFNFFAQVTSAAVGATISIKEDTLSSYAGYTITSPASNPTSPTQGGSSGGSTPTPTSPTNPTPISTATTTVTFVNGIAPVAQIQGGSDGTSADSEDLDWAPVGGAEDYGIYVDDNLFDTTDNTSYDTGDILMPDSQYTFTVEALDGSEDAPATVSLATPTHGIWSNLIAAVANIFTASSQTQPTAATASVTKTTPNQAPLPAKGTAKILTVLLSFKDTNPSNLDTPTNVDNIMFNNTNSVSSYYEETSFGQLQISGDVDPNIIHLNGYTPTNVAPDPTILSNKVMMQVQTLNDKNQPVNSFVPLYETVNKALVKDGYHPNNYDMVIYVWPHTPTDIAGAADSIGGFLPGGDIKGRIWINGPQSELNFGNNPIPLAQAQPSVYAHEIGHKLGLHHADLVTCSSALAPVTFCNYPGLVQRGDPENVMGNSGAFQINPYDKNLLGWIPSQQITQSGIYTVVADEFNQTKELYIPTSNNGQFSFDYRQNVGTFDSQLDTAATQGVSIEAENSPFSPLTGDTFHILVFNTTSSSPYMIDGSVFPDSIDGFQITQLNHNSTSANVFVRLMSDAKTTASVTGWNNFSTPFSVSWNPINGISNGNGGYKLYRDGNLIYNGPNTSYTATTADDYQTSAGANHTYTVQGYDSFPNVNEYDLPLSAGVNPVAPALQTIKATLGFSNTGYVGNTISWTPVSDSGITGYQILVDGTSIGTFTAQNQPVHDAETINFLAQSHTYVVKAVGKNQALYAPSAPLQSTATKLIGCISYTVCAPNTEYIFDIKDVVQDDSIGGPVIINTSSSHSIKFLPGGQTFTVGPTSNAAYWYSSHMSNASGVEVLN